MLLRVLIFTQHFAPELTAGRFRVEAFARALLERGHEVQVISPVPNHPTGVIDPRFRGHLRVRRDIDGIRSDHVWLVTSPNRSMRHRLAYYGSYAAMATIDGVVAQAPDVVLASSPPLSVGAAAAAVARRHRAPWVLDVRDIWPDVAVALGELTAPWQVALTTRLERRLYRSAARILTVTESFRRDIAERVSDPEKVALVRNGTTRAWLRRGEAAPDRAAAQLPDETFVWTYAGNLGLSHGLEVAVEAAALLGAGFQLLVVGDGPLRAELEARARGLPPETVAFREPVEPDQVAKVLRASDALLVIQRGDLTKVVSSKLYDCCAVGRPVLVVGAGEMCRLVEEASAGLVVSPEDPAALAAAVRRLRDEPQLRASLESRGRELAKRNLREVQGEQVVAILEHAAAA